MSVDSKEYHSRRAAQEKARAEQAKDESIRRLHLDLAQRHSERIEAMVPPAQQSA